MNLEELKLNRFIYRAKATPVLEDPVYMSSNVASQKKVKGSYGSGGDEDAKNVLTGTVITSCYVRSSDKNTRVELVPVSFNNTGFDVFGEQTFEDALIAWQDVNIPAVVIDHNGIYAIDGFFENLFALNLEFAESAVSILTINVSLIVANTASFTYHDVIQPVVYIGQVESDGTFIILPDGFTCDHAFTGFYEMTHNFGDLNYTVQVTCLGGAGYIDDAIASITDITANTFVVNIYDAAAAFAPADTAFFLTVSRVVT